MLNPLNQGFIQFIFTDLFGFCYFVLPVFLAFTCQVLLCFRTKRILLKLLPAALGVLLIAAVLGAFLALGENLLYLFPLGIAGLIWLGILAGWLVYGAARLLCRLTKKTPYG